MIVEYDGGPFVGWQRQANGRSVQGALEAAAFRLTGERPTVRGAGRTDAGVHALGQVAHLDLARAWPGDRLADALNAHLRPDPVAVLSAEPVADAFDARFSALRRHYRYRIVNRRAPLAIERGRAWRVGRRLDAEAMDAAARHLVGTHDFTTFRSTECQAKSAVKTLDRLDVVRSGEEIVIEASARSFLHNQIRSFAGSLKLVGEGKWRPAQVAEALEARDRRACGPIAPPDGLYLVRVDYPEAFSPTGRG
nr:tRNA pseudouridine(38-40) synthase TruA [Propylenella binzhouense]